MSNGESHTYIRTKIIIIVLIITNLLMLTYVYGDEPEKGEIVRVGYFNLDYFNEVDGDGKRSGYGYEYLMEIAKYTGWNYDFVDKAINPETGEEHLLTYEEALKLLELGKIDLICNIRKTPETEKSFLLLGFPLGDIHGTQLFTAINKDKKDLYNQLGEAIEAISMNEPQLSGELYIKHHKNVKDKKIAFTREEQEYIKNNPIAIVGVESSFIPIEYYNGEAKNEENKIEGITGDVLTRLSHTTGLTFKMVKYDEYKEAQSRDGVQIFPSFVYDYSWAEENNVRLAQPYLDIPVSAVTREDVKNYRDSNLKFAVLKNYFLTEKVKETIPEGQLIYFESMQHCVKAVNDGKADVTFIPTYSADYFSSHATYNHIRTYATPEFNYVLAFAVSNSSDVMLYKIIGKAVRSIEKSDIDAIVFENILFNEREICPLDYVYEYPVGAIIIVCLLWLLMIGIIFRYRKLNKEVKREMHIGDERIQIALSQTNLLIWDYDMVNNSITRINTGRPWQAMMDEIENVPDCFIETEYVHPDYIEGFKQLFIDMKEGKKVASGLFRVMQILENGEWTKEYLWVEIKITNIFDELGKPIRAVGMVENVTRKINEELRLKEKATRDPLTNLLNRASFQACVEEFLNEPNKERGEDTISALIIIDTDDFKAANDTYGHFYGDEVLKGIAVKLLKCFRTGDYVGRLGGDEFIIFMKNAKSEKAVDERAKQICSELIFEKDDLITTCSVGIVMVPNKPTEYNSIYKKADYALYEAKRHGKCGYIIWHG